MIKRDNNTYMKEERVEKKIETLLGFTKRRERERPKEEDRKKRMKKERETKKK